MNDVQRSPRRMMAALALGLAACTGLAHAQAPAASKASDSHESHESHQPAAPASEVAWIQGEVRRIDAEGGKLTLRHEAIPQFDMVAMTMAFRVARPTLLDGLNVGDRVRFRLDKIDRRLVLVELQKLP